MNKGWTKKAASAWWSCCMVKFGTVDKRPGSGRRRELMKTSTQLSRCCWVRKTNLRATEQSEKFHVRWGDPSIVSFADYSHRSAYNVLLEEKTCSTTDWSAQHAQCTLHNDILTVCSLRDDNVITSKPAWKLKHANSILETFEYFCQISSKLIYVISSYTISKLGRFSRHSVEVS